ncbi:hypothetical protein JCGZ_08872 [Jatropha curcas]|uniref:Uncharacterized protein n=1 Tax=Jatropha curcas TaxID=180498 RepID=A0A067KW85_JATCU|nr:hypothetical protein JCGZ_08872 [Jatropha curcas]
MIVQPRWLNLEPRMKQIWRTTPWNENRKGLKDSSIVNGNRRGSLNPLFEDDRTTDDMDSVIHEKHENLPEEDNADLGYELQPENLNPNQSSDDIRVDSLANLGHNADTVIDTQEENDTIEDFEDCHGDPGHPCK